MSAFTTPSYPYLVPDAEPQAEVASAPQETVAPSIVTETIAAPVKAKAKAKRKKKRAAPRAKKPDPILTAASMANAPPSSASMPVGVRPEAEGAAEATALVAPTISRAARYDAHFSPDVPARPDLAPVLRSTWYQRFVLRLSAFRSRAVERPDGSLDLRAGSLTIGQQASACAIAIGIMCSGAYAVFAIWG